MTKQMVSKNFSLNELQCPCCDEYEIDQPFVDKLQTVRDGLNLPMHVNSWFRCKRHNKNVGGAENSKHLTGNAVDICTVDFGAPAKYQLMFLGFIHFPGIGYGKDFVHFDSRDMNAMAFWSYD